MTRKKILQNGLALICFFAACHVSRQSTAPIINTMSEFDKQGHRGCRGLMPENTIPAMLHAMALGVTTLEMDVVITADSQVVLSHDPFFNHEISTLNAGKPNQQGFSAADEKKYRIYGMTYSEVSAIDVGLKPHPRFPRQQKLAAVKPLLTAVFDSVLAFAERTHRPIPFFNIETKCTPEGDGKLHPAPKEFVELLVTVIRAKKMEDRVTIQSFDFRTLQYLHVTYPAIHTAMLIEGDDKRPFQEQLADLKFTPTIYSPAFERVTPELIRNCHEQGIKIIPWTVNQKEKILELKAAGVDGIITDYPDLFN
jgi:glycerophosphoryl diester phosphodiesterase